MTIEGRADGIFQDELQCMVIDEIKGMYQNVESLDAPYEVHKAQAMCYAYIFAKQNELKELGVQMTYCNLDTEEVKRFRENYSFDELEEWFVSLTDQYKKWADFQCEWRKRRQESIQTLDFPFPYRDGQKKLVQDVYRTIARRKNLFLQAPTGVGKTISTIYPAVRAMGENLAERIFILLQNDYGNGCKGNVYY